ncbi:MAG TPA: AAA family ATPase [Streptosporangiaceae bacterium]
MGRQITLAEIRNLLLRARAGSSQCVVIEGTAGVGKSRLLQAATSEAQALGMTIANCRATELDRVAPLSTLLSGLRRGGLAGVDSATLGGHGNDRFWLVDRIRELIETHVHNRPLYVAIDDAHWADEFTALALRTLVPELAAEPVFWILTLSPRAPLCPAAAIVDQLVTEGAHRIELGPLGDGAVAELCAEALGAVPDAATLALAGRASGNPFLLQLLFSTLRDSGQLAVADGNGTVLPGSLPAPFLDAVVLRYQDLSADMRGLLDAGAILNRPFTVHEAAGLLSRGTVELLPIAREAVQAGILAADGGKLWFNHDLIREAVHSTMCEPIKIALYREAAASMGAIKAQSADGPLNQVPAESAGRPVCKAGEACRPAARRLRDTTNQLAARIGCYRNGAPAGPPTGVLDPIRTQFMVIQEYSRVCAGKSAGADRAGAEAAIRAGVIGEHPAVVFGNVARGAAAYDQGELDTAIRWTQAAVEAAAAAADTAGLSHPQFWLTPVLAAADRFEEAEASCTRGRGHALLPAAAWSTPMCHYRAAELHRAQGLLAQAADEAQKALESAERLNVPQLSLPSLALLLEVAVHRGDLAAAGRYAGRLAHRTEGSALDLRWPLAFYQDAIGEHKLALKTAMPLIEALRERPVLTAAPAAGPALLKIAQRAGATVPAGAIIDALNRLAELNPRVPSLAGAAKHAAGLHNGDLETLQLALQRLASSPRPLARAAALQDTACAEHEAGYRRGAVSHLEEALDLYIKAGAQYHAATAQRLLRDYGPQREPRANRSNPALCPKLTQSELPVAQLVTEGLTNREIATRLYLSPHTVDSHLRHIFSKFGVNNRVELTRRFDHQDAEAEAVLAGR